MSKNTSTKKRFDDLIEELETDKQFKEIWLHSDNGSSLCALINGRVGWLMFLRHECDAGFSTRNPDIDSNQEIDFELSNGQVDSYPESWTYPVEVIASALKSYLRDGQQPLQVEWHDDST